MEGTFKCPHCGRYFVIDGQGNAVPLPLDMDEQGTAALEAAAERLGWVFGETKAGGETDGTG